MRSNGVDAGLNLEVDSATDLQGGLKPVCKCVAEGFVYLFALRVGGARHHRIARVAKSGLT